jgi:hypothetical protein
MLYLAIKAALSGVLAALVSGGRQTQSRLRSPGSPERFQPTQIARGFREEPLAKGRNL